LLITLQYILIANYIITCIRLLISYEDTTKKLRCHSEGFVSSEILSRYLPWTGCTAGVCPEGS